MENIKLLIQKKKGSKDNVLTTEQLNKILGVSELNEELIKIMKEITLLKNKKEISKEKLLSLLNEDVLLLGQPLNITNVGSIEKNNKIKSGTIYYNSRKDCIRLKKKEGWTNL